MPSPSWPSQKKGVNSCQKTQNYHSSYQAVPSLVKKKKQDLSWSGYCSQHSLSTVTISSSFRTSILRVFHSPTLIIEFQQEVSNLLQNPSTPDCTAFDGSKTIRPNQSPLSRTVTGITKPECSSPLWSLSPECWGLCLSLWEGSGYLRTEPNVQQDDAMTDGQRGLVILKVSGSNCSIPYLGSDKTQSPSSKSSFVRASYKCASSNQWCWKNGHSHYWEKSLKRVTRQKVPEKLFMEESSRQLLLSELQGVSGSPAVPSLPSGQKSCTLLGQLHVVWVGLPPSPPPPFLSGQGKHWVQLPPVQDLNLHLSLSQHVSLTVGTFPSVRETFWNSLKFKNKNL